MPCFVVNLSLGGEMPCFAAFHAAARVVIENNWLGTWIYVTQCAASMAAGQCVT